MAANRASHPRSDSSAVTMLVSTPARHPAILDLNRAPTTDSVASSRK